MPGEILFLAHRVPFPPDRGDKIRSHHLLKRLAEIAPVHVGCLAETDGDMAQESELAEIARSHFLARRAKPLPLAGIEALARGLPVSLTAFDHAGLRRWVAATLAERPIGTVFVFSGQMGQYVPADFGGRVVVDLCDVDSAKFEAYGKQGGPRAWIDRREGRLLAREEERLAHRAHCTLFVSKAEAALFRSRLRSPAGVRIEALRNGIDTTTFDPVAVAPHPELAAEPGPHLVFTGQMDYAPNVTAALRTAERLLPAIRRAHPGATFHVVGRAPVPQLRRLDGRNGIRVWGEVPDVRPFLVAADAVLAPLEIARGIQNKVLEAMAMARPVVLSPEAATGIDARDGEHFAVAAHDQALIDRALALLQDATAAATMGVAARRYVVEHQGWAAMLVPLSEIVGARGAEARRDAA
ncbi:TIGR03087 family PEP-CTERM/XrtA system glycosyltransferase [Pelagerythrobacter rhizovicinus]|uniref:TIGR03087 family PEP-CTERM/XrtA system glycosyltransferase n=1 Tax=Pelagerythrobacter rhizovicinus TaxID=2268576 RepID=A0A4Q2KR32_9SPHN|nr:TIGR03087 family PEP-CTERM/XrtA system glycosyltransferase [Pelagerythrobacter rhizovicinus]RXZ65771.1 TIGR03087 family PEP-CTERM/XrtA system glycosyltransferase [Pelagerythrobacter rhizovicinus]